MLGWTGGGASAPNCNSLKIKLRREREICEVMSPF